MVVKDGDESHGTMSKVTLNPSQAFPTYHILLLDPVHLHPLLFVGASL